MKVYRDRVAGQPAVRGRTRAEALEARRRGSAKGGEGIGLDDGTRPFAASVRRPAGELPDGADYAGELEPGPEWPGARPISTAAVDAAALEARRAAKVERPAPLAGEVRAAAIRGCLAACESHRWIHGAATLFVEALAVLLGCPVEEADALVSAEAAMRRGDRNPRG